LENNSFFNALEIVASPPHPLAFFTVMLALLESPDALRTRAKRTPWRKTLGGLTLA
jgi:hypothetical protein